MNRRCRIGAVAAAFVLYSATLLSARPGTVVLKDGKTFEGDVTERKDQGQVDIVVEGKKFTFGVGNIARVDFDESAPEPAPGQRQPPGQPGMSAEQEFEKRLAGLGPRDAAGRIKLARWAFDRQEYDMAREALRQAIAIDARNKEAQEFMRTIDAQQRLDRRTAAGNRPPPPAKPGTPPPTPPAEPDGDDDATPPRNARPAQGGGGGALRPLTPDEINRIRMMEWRRDDRGVNVRLLNNVKRRFVARARDVKPADFNAMDVIEQAWMIKEDGSGDMVNDVRIVNDPPALAEFRTGVQRPVLTTCAAQACHGGGAGSEQLALFHRADKEPEAYANFLALNNYVGKVGGAPAPDEKDKKAAPGGRSPLAPAGGREARMIDRNRPEDSLLIQYGLPYDVADAPHPEVHGFKTLFKTRNDARYRQFVRWISDGLAPLQDDYGIDMAGGGEEAAGARQGPPGRQGEGEAPAEEAEEAPEAQPPARQPPGVPRAPERAAPPVQR